MSKALSEKAKEAQREYMRKWKAENRDKCNAYMRAWRKDNPDKIREYNQRYWERKVKEQEQEG